MTNYSTLDSLFTQSIQGKRVIVRACFNASIEEERIVNAFRIDASLATIDELLFRGAHVVAISHRSGDPSLSLLPIVGYLNERGYRPKLARTIEEARVLAQGYPFVVLENLRRDPGEETASATYAKQLATLGEVFVVDDFSVLHRPHASVVVLPTLLPTVIGRSVAQEVEMLEKAVTPKSPAYAIFGGGKFGTKTPLIRKCLETYDGVLVAGALMNDFYVAQGYEVGTSRVSSEPVSDMVTHPRLVLPTVVTAKSGVADREAEPNTVSTEEAIVDVAPKGIADFLSALRGARTVLWNGPLGFYELGYTGGTQALAEALLASQADLIIGGGDTVSALSALGLQQRFAYLSTGGGAMLAFVLSGTLPGLEVLTRPK